MPTLKIRTAFENRKYCSAKFLFLVVYQRFHA